MLSLSITIVHILACTFLVLVVLLQTGKGADMGAVFGGSSSTVFGSSGAGNFLTRLTTATAVIFMLTSLSLTYLSAHRTTETIMDTAPTAAAPMTAPAAPLEAPPIGVPPPAAPVQEQAEQPAAQGEPAGVAESEQAPVADADAAAAEQPGS